MALRIDYTLKELQGLPKSRVKAREQRLPHYFTGKACRNGHIDWRDTHKGNCRSCRQLSYKSCMENPERRKTKQIYNKAWKRSELGKLSNRNTHLKKRYGITHDDYLVMLGSQNGKCKICGTTETKNKNQNYLSVDHCHKTNKIRGLLCDDCNNALGRIEDDLTRANNIIKYLEESA